MPHLYTRAGDDGYTYCAALGTRVPKAHIIMEFVGTLDEANSYIGFARSLMPLYLSEIDSDLRRIQRLLFKIGFSLARRRPEVTEDDLKWIENITDKYYGEEALKYFILPSGPSPSSVLHVARTVVRRAERQLVRLQLDNVIKVDPILLKVINRMSDALFAMALWVSRKLGFEPEPAE